MFSYYCWRATHTTYMYDELFTYRTLTSRGLHYCIADWRFPNNQVFFSILTWFINLFGNRYLTVRGISVLCCTINLYLIYLLANKFFSKALSLLCSILYSACYMVIWVSTQGRGYTLSITLMLFSFILLYDICYEQVHRRNFILYSVLLALQLYTVSTTIYAIILLSLVGGFVLLYNKNYKTLVRLIKYSIFAAVGTVILYTPTILGMGSMSLLRKYNNLSADDAIFGMGAKAAIMIVLQHPIEAFFSGVNDIISNPFIQSSSLSDIRLNYLDYVKKLLNNYLQLPLWINAMLVILPLIGAACGMVKTLHKKESKNNMFLYLFLLIPLPITLISPFIQKLFSPMRALLYLCIVFSFGIVFTIYIFVNNQRCIKFNNNSIINILVFIVFTICFIVGFSKKAVKIAEPHEQEVYKALVSTNAYQYGKTLFGSIFPQGQLFFHYDKETEQEMEQPEYVLLLEEQTSPQNTEELYQTQLIYSEIPWDYIHSNLKEVYHQDDIIVYVKK